MDNKRILSIVGLVLTFFACAAIGYFIPIGERSASTLFASGTGGGGGGGGADDVLFGGGTSGGSSRGSSRGADASAPDAGNTVGADSPMQEGVAAGAAQTPGGAQASGTQMAGAQTPATQSGTPANASQTGAASQAGVASQAGAASQTAVGGASAAVGQSSTMPVIEGKPLVGRANKRFGFACRAKATVASGDPLEYRLCEVGTSEVKYRSTNGGFVLVVPSESGKYDLVVENTRTREQTRMTIGGFDKVVKLSAAMLQEKLNKPMDDWFYIYFVEDKDLTIDYEYIPEGFVPARSVGALMSDRTANGWTIEVVGTPQYDEYNQVRRFKVRIKE